MTKTGQPAKILLNSVAAKAPRHLYSKNVSLKLFNETQPYLNENALLNWTATITAIFTENKKDLGMLSPSI